jgi:hypothetical protein
LGVLERRVARIPAGGQVRLRIQIVAPLASRWLDDIQVELSEPPDGIALKDESVRPGDCEIIVTGDAAKLKPGLQGNLILLAFGERSRQGADGKGPKEKQRIPLGAFPAIPFEIVAP